MTQPVNLSGGVPETVIAAAPHHVTAQLQAALAHEGDARREKVVEVVAAFPRLLEGWAALGDLGRDVIEQYACYRVGYHRGLDTLRASGWRGSGYVRWAHETNRGFLRALDGLRRCAGAIGEVDEAERCALFLLQLDPAGPWSASPAPS